MKLALCLLLILVLTTVRAQKAVIDKDACDKWVSLQEINDQACLISNDGKYIAYQYGSKKSGSSIIVKDASGLFEHTFSGATNPRISNSNHFVAMLPGDSLVIFSLRERQSVYIKNVLSYSMPSSGEGDWLAYIDNGRVGELHVRNLRTSSEKSFPRVEEFLFNEQGTVLVIRMPNKLLWFDLLRNSEQIISENRNIRNITFDKKGRQIGFITSNEEKRSLNLFSWNMKSTIDLLANPAYVDIPGFSISEAPLKFSEDGSKLFFECIKKWKKLPHIGDSIISDKVNIWSYKDKYLQERQYSRMSGLKDRHFMFSINISNGKILQLENDSLFLDRGAIGNKFALLCNMVSDDEFYWNNETQVLGIISLNDGSITKIFETKYPGFVYSSLSPDEKSVIWFDSKSKNYYSYETSKNIIQNISSRISNPLSVSQRGEADKVGIRRAPYGVGPFVQNGEALLIYDQFDIWKLDPLGSNMPINLTNGYGRKHNLRFRVIDNNGLPISISKKEILIWAFDYTTKENGFWKMTVDKKVDPHKLVMESRAYYFYPSSLVSWPNEMDPTRFKPVKANGASAFVVRRMSTSEAPNLFYSKDLKSYWPVSSLSPNSTYNWMTSQLVSWTLPNGLKSQGILYRPENFDSSHKYPVILNYYERRSEGLNIYRSPELASHNINIPWYVSRGYLVFEPDIYYQTGRTAKSILEVITSAAKHLSNFSYIDSNRMGIQGQSFGGYETNVIVTGTNIFAAACEMAGPTDIISEYGSIRPGGHNNQVSADIGQRNLGVFPWSNPEVFIENSPVFHIEKASTPLLMVHNRNDNAILFSQAVELFLGLRRLNKKVWLLEYEKEGHSITEESNKLDFTIRMQQFFDHYLKGKAAPIWMTEGVPANKKGIVSGLLPDTTMGIP